MDTPTGMDTPSKPRKWRIIGLVFLMGMALLCSAASYASMTGPGVAVEAQVVGIYWLQNDPRSQQPDPDHHAVGLLAQCHRTPRFSRTIGDRHLVLWSCP